MAMDGKQIKVGTIPTNRLASAPALDSNLAWRKPVAVLHLVGNATVATINGLTPTAGDAYVVTDAGTITAGSLSVTAGDLVEYTGTVWLKIVVASGGFVPSGTRAVLATQTALISPYTDTSDDGKIVSFSGASNTGSATGESTDGNSIIVSGDSGYFTNQGFVFSGTVPTGTWVAFGSGSITAGAGLAFAGLTLNIGDVNRGIQANANDLEFAVSEVLDAGGGLKVGSASYKMVVEPADFAGTGLVDDGSDNLAVDQATGSVTFTGGTWSFPVDVLQVTGTPDSANDAVNKTYVDNAITGVRWKVPVAVVQLIGNVVTEGLIGNATVATINGLSPAAGDAYVVTDAGTLTTGSLSVAAGDLVEYSGSAWVKLVAQSGGFVPSGTTALLSMATALITPYTDTTDDGKIAKFAGASNTATLSVPLAGDAVVISAPGTAGVDQGDLKEYSGTAWVEVVAGSGGFVPLDTRAIVSTQTILVSPYTDATDDGKIVTFSGVSNTGSNTSQAIDGNGVLVNGEAGYFENGAFVFDGTVPTGSWVQFSGAGQVVAGAGLTKSYNTLNIGDANKGVQVNTDSVQIDASEIVSSTGGLEQVSGGGNEHLLKIKIVNTSVAISTSGLQAAVPGTGNKGMTASVTTSDNDSATATTVAAAFAAGSQPMITVNGAQEPVGNGTKTGVAFYFSGDGGTTARAFSAVIAGDTIRFNGSVAGYELAATDRIDLWSNPAV